MKHFKHIDLVEQNPKFLEVAKISLEKYSSKIDQYYPIGSIFIFARLKSLIYGRYINILVF